MKKATRQKMIYVITVFLAIIFIITLLPGILF
ncbi:hypothetical protein SAMN04488529_10392 [Clostridium gasigenes]|uniref:DUF4044 domain-containing protein n=1 Tax=Clostridium gasigenes TaxID=94869 RepID=A0A1H0RB74_9CLOT|nr:hypothetical protein SAMN04488529_10392 [Clostridium gasigenes]